MAGEGNPNWVDKFEPWMVDKAHELFSQGKSITQVCCGLGIVRETYYQWAKNPDHPFYYHAKKGEQLSQAYWEDKGREGIFGEIDKFAGSSWQFVLKNRFRDSYQADNKDEKPVNETLLEKLLEKL